MQAWYQLSEAGTERKIPARLPGEEPQKEPSKLTRRYGILHVRIPPRSGNKAKCNWKNQAIVFRDGIIDNCDWRITNKLHSTRSESRATEPHSEPAMQLCRWINRGIRTRERTHRSMRKAQEYTCIRWDLDRVWALANKSTVYPRAKYLWQILFY
jgi:hypothetical protein